MPKVLCLFSLVVSALLLLLFLVDLVVAVPFGRSMILDAGFIIAAGVLAALSYLTYKEQR